MNRYIIKAFIIINLILLYSCKSDSNQIDQASSKIISTPPIGMVSIPAGTLSMGGDNDQASENEYPKHDVKIDAFFMDETEVTNSQYSEFVAATNYKSIAERNIEWDSIKVQLPEGSPKPPDSLLAAGSLVFIGTDSKVSMNDPSQWWQWTIGANWQHPTGPNSTISSIMNHPVVHIAWEDAVAYCDWSGKRLPTEAEWEWAARGGKKNMIYPWGNDAIDDDNPRANYYQGLFPLKNTATDGYISTAPVKSYQANDYGLYDMSGNVWEWCQDWFDVTVYESKKGKLNGSQGPSKAYNPAMPYQKERVIRGGSFLCNDSYCSGYRNARRMGTTMDTGLNHTGFRCVKDTAMDK